MSRIRTIKPGFWKDEDLSALPADAHMLAAALLNYADDEGYFNANPALVKAECCPLRESSVSVHESLQLLQKIRFIETGPAENGKRYGRVTNFGEHQRVNRPTASKIKALKISWEDSSKAHAQVSEPSPPEGKGREGNKEGKGKELTGQLSPAPDEFVQRFAELKLLYPKRGGSQRWPTAQKHIRARLREGHTWDEILDGAKRYAAFLRAAGKERTEFVQQAATFVGTDKAFMEPWELPTNGTEPRRTKPYKPEPVTPEQLEKDREAFKRDMQRLGVRT